MACDVFALCFDANDPLRLARFWAGVLGWELAEGGIELLPTDDTGFRIRFLPTQVQKAGPNQMHFDLTSTSLENQEETVARALRLGARHLDVGQLPEEQHVVLADPEGNEFCVIEPGNKFLADCGFIGALSCDGSQEVGYFWSAALGWPLVWDQDQETAIRSPQGGPKITWGGPPFTPKVGNNRLHFDLAPAVGGDQSAEVERLLALGATHVDIGQGSVPWVVLADPDGNEFCVVRGGVTSLPRVKGRYRWRTRLRKILPWRPPLYLLVPKGRDCGDHDWYRHDDDAWHCYHCRAVHNGDVER